MGDSNKGFVFGGADAAQANKESAEAYQKDWVDPIRKNREAWARQGEGSPWLWMLEKAASVPVWWNTNTDLPQEYQPEIESSKSFEDRLEKLRQANKK